MTPQDVNKRLLACLDNLRKVLDDLKSDDYAAAQAKGVYEVAKARSFLTTDGPVESRKMRAIELTDTERQALDLAEVRHRASQELMRFLKVEIEVLRTVSSTIRAEMSL